MNCALTSSGGRPASDPNKLSSEPSSTNPPPAVRSSIIDRKRGAAWIRFAFPTWWHYDVLQGLEYLRSADIAPGERMVEAIELVASKRNSAAAVAARHPVP